MIANNGTNEHIFFYKILAMNVQPFVYFLFAALFWVILKITRPNRMNLTQFKDNLLVTICLIGYLLQLSIVESTLQLFK